MATRRFTRKINKPPRKISLGKWGRRILYFLLAGGGIGFLVIAGVILWWSKDLPDPKSIDERRIHESTKIFDSTGTHLLYEIGDIHRTKIGLDKISPHIINATLAAEDDQFFNHRGLNMRGITRAFLVNIRGGGRHQGGSTITQQLIKNSMLSPEKTFQRKVKEAVLSLELEQRFTKEEILEMYLNDIPYGSLTYGVEAAAQTFFGTSAENVTLAQAGILASLPKAPTRLSPYGSRVEELKGRQEHVLQRMADLGIITQKEADNAKKEDLQFLPRRESIQAPHFVFYVKELLEKEYGERVVEQGGLTVITTLDMRLQSLAEEKLKENQAQLNSLNASNASLVSINPQNGDILAMSGSIDYFNEEIDGNVNVSIRHRSPGSSLKPFIYMAAFEKGYTPDTLLVDVETDFGQGYTPRNYNLAEYGPISLRLALGNSLNIPAVKALHLVGMRDSIDLVQRLGLTSLNDPDRYGLSLVLGGGEVRLLDLTSGYGVLANEGVKYPHRAILKVEAEGSVIFDAKEEKVSGSEVVKPQIAHLITDVLADNSARTMMFGANSHLQLGSRPVAAKTGTAQEFRDGWLVGYTPSLVTGVWVGNNDNSPMTDRSGGMRTAGPIWNSYMRAALDGTPIEHFVKPAPIQNVPNSVLRGELPEVKGKWVPEAQTLYTTDCPMAVGHHRTVKELRSILHYINKNNPLSTENSRNDSQYGRWEAAIAAWRDKHNEKYNNDPGQPIYVDSLPEPACPIGDEDDLPKVRIIEPNTTILKESPVTVRVEVETKKELREVRFILDGEIVSRRNADESFEVTLSFEEDVSGRKTLEILAITEDRFIGRAHRTFIINPDDNPPEVILHYPFNNTQLTKDDFPLEIKITATDTDSGIDFVDVLYSKSGETRNQRIQRNNTVSPMGPNRYDVKWNSPPAPGTYEIFVLAYDKSGNFTESIRHTVTIEEE